jgi:hypothetical protein
MEISIIYLLERLTGESPKINKDLTTFDNILSTSKGICYNQLNELLLYYGYDRITNENLFNFLLRLEDEPKDKIYSIEQFHHIIDVFNKVSLLLFGNNKYAFKTLASDDNQLNRVKKLITHKEIDFYKSRGDLMQSIVEIESEDTVYLGEYIRQEINRGYENDHDNHFWADEKKRMDHVTPIGISNNDTYLISDTMDVYIATSMRERHEYVIINDFIKEVFNRPEIKMLNLRYFNPTQAYCQNRVDKGLTEALMLKRADCTIYLAQESDTLGKDSELATTLAQGKPVIVYVPEGNPADVDRLIDISSKMYKQKKRKDVLLHLISIFEAKLIWLKEEKELRNSIDSEGVDEDQLYSRLCSIVRTKYDSRASGLKEKHPLGIQINLETGVGNGVLVARTPSQCATLLRGIILNELDYFLDPKLPKIDEDFIYLRESTTSSIFRVITNNFLLTNTFWNFYNNKED